MPLAKIHVVEGRYHEERLTKASAAIQAALMNTLRLPPEDFYQLIFESPKNAFSTRRRSSACTIPTT
jgi:phenylpyruvate tautomerase PptA (4-oxalocrotonate tautomerase family)